MEDAGKMFVLAQLSDIIPIEPKKQAQSKTEAVFHELESVHIGQVGTRTVGAGVLTCCVQIVKDMGLCVAIYDVIRVGDAIIHPGEGFARCHVHFEAVFFRPFVGEVIAGVLQASSCKGLQSGHGGAPAAADVRAVSLGFFNEIHVAPHQLQAPAELYGLPCGG